MFGKKQMDPLGQQIAFAIGAGRVGVGIGTFFATRPALRALGFGESDATGRTFARILGARDLGVGALTLALRDDPNALRNVILASTCLDLADAVAFGTATATSETRRGGLTGVAFGGAAAVAGFWAWRRLSD
ncbi:MAG TPA: DUF4267 domain-containing protein [Solirubrobacterales bacterium]|nr:DUF4267 domain-containing protein [Solirubrobacterales bacterium]